MNFCDSITKLGNNNHVENKVPRSGDKRKADCPGPGESKRVASQNLYIRLAEESPSRVNSPYCSTDEDGYDSYHELETEVCEDSSSEEEAGLNVSDDERDELELADGCTSDDSTTTFGKLDIIEYDVASSTDYDVNDDIDSLCTDSSAGSTASEDVFLTLALTEMVDSDFTIFADTEESDETGSDPELGRADYWECVKCKNKQNNPMYRYCEKCYQVRKSHFPPRPKKKRNGKGRKMSHSGSHEAVNGPSPISNQLPTPLSDDEGSNCGKDTKPYFCSNRSKAAVKRRKSRANDSAGESVSSSDSEVVADSGAEAPSSKSSSPLKSLQKAAVVEQESSAALKLKVESSGFSLRRYLSLQLSQGTKDSGFSSNGSSQESGSPCFERDISFTSPGPSDPRQSISEDEKELNKVVSLKATKSDMGVESPKLVNGGYYSDPSDSELCAICKVSQKGAVFVHTTKACSGCCYTCALKTWKRYKNCPFCKAKPKNVMKLFTH